MDLAEELNCVWLAVEASKLSAFDLSALGDGGPKIQIPCVSAPLSVGDFLDRISILELKVAKIPDSHGASKQLFQFSRSIDRLPSNLQKFTYLALQLFAKINSALWHAEDLGRRPENTDEENGRVYGAVKRLNRLRSELKNHIDTLVKSDFMDEKKYV